MDADIVTNVDMLLFGDESSGGNLPTNASPMKPEVASKQSKNVQQKRSSQTSGKRKAPVMAKKASASKSKVARKENNTKEQ